MKLEKTTKVKEEVQTFKQPIDYVITHKGNDGKPKTLGFKTLPEARVTGLVMYRNRTFIKLENIKGVKLTI